MQIKYVFATLLIDSPYPKCPPFKIQPSCNTQTTYFVLNLEVTTLASKVGCWSILLLVMHNVLPILMVLTKC